MEVESEALAVRVARRHRRPSAGRSHPDSALLQLAHSTFCAVTFSDDGKPMLAQIKKLMLGNGLAQAIQFAGIPVLSRLYEPTSFAPLYQAQALATILAIFATLQLHLALPQARDEAEAARWSKAVIALCMAICVILAPFAYVLFHNPWAVVLTLCLGVTNTIVNFQLYHERFSAIAFFQLTRALCIVAAQISLQALFHLDDLLMATLAAECLVTLVFLVRAGLRWPTPKDLRVGVELARQRPNFSVFGTLHEATSSAVFFAPLFLFSHFFSNATGAQFAMANRLVWAPVVLLSASAAQVTYQRFCRHTPQTLWDTLKDYLRESRRHAAWGVLALIMAMTAAPAIVHLVLGRNWEVAGAMTPPLLLWGAAFLGSIPFRSACRALSLQRLQLMVEVATGLAFVVVFLCHSSSAVGTLWTIAALAVAQNVALAWIVKLRIAPLARV
ncbi:hypothetical protein CDL60_16570 [Roseateles noduli]|nr:hypothetical protein CDL60_16570 [Roseateles noduli]